MPPELDVVDFSGGCACCVAASAFSLTIARLLRRGTVDRLFILLAESADPGAVADALWSGPLAGGLAGVEIVGVMASDTPQRLLAATRRAGLGAADVLLLDSLSDPQAVPTLQASPSLADTGRGSRHRDPAARRARLGRPAIAAGRGARSGALALAERRPWGGDGSLTRRPAMTPLSLGLASRRAFDRRRPRPPCARWPGTGATELRRSSDPARMVRLGRCTGDVVGAYGVAARIAHRMPDPVRCADRPGGRRERLGKGARPVVRRGV
jgi:hypothetical protein